jgi:hypothetical protein
VSYPAQKVQLRVRGGRSARLDAQGGARQDSGCCNFWSEEKLGRDELVEAIAHYYREHGVSFERVVFPFKGPKNVGLVSNPPVVRS